MHLLRGKRNIKISMQTANAISCELINIAKYVTMEFSSKPRSLNEIDCWKATEFRTFLCYLRPLVLRSHLSPQQYHHFMLMHVAVTILSSNSMLNMYCDYAENLLKEFVDQMSELYGSTAVIYTIHSLIHVCDDVRRLGTLDEYSAFPFENALGMLKK
ncbi:uncharacterized protein LOC136076155 [Hydra vulgaris]|uniref:Uncharacterized protein LOC136076155 n=1 Tax=Hydra vulgaris TaxID=6087 RepID=A0ABM4B9X0_HYDVU